MKFLLRMVVAAFALIGIAYLTGESLIVLQGETMGDRFLPALFAALVLAISNATIRPVLRLFALPLRIVTLGLFGLVINALMVYFAHWIVDGFQVVGFWQAIVVAIIMSIVNAFATSAIDKDD